MAGKGSGGNHNRRTCPATGKAGYRTRRQIIEKVKQDSVLIETASEEGLDKDGGLWHEFDVDKSHLVKEKHWWPQQKR
ncbi:MAG: hypothetical protein ABI366_09355 [Ginsengibacter sp.]